METIHLTRQLDLIDLSDLKSKIIIVGAGAIGSFAALALTKMGFSNVHVYDDDEIDPENMNCQFYRMADIGRKKVEALAEMIYDFTGTAITKYDQRVTNEDILAANVVISAVDCMDARKVIFEQTRGQHFLDSRMGAEYIAMYSVDMMNVEAVKEFKNSLHGNDDAVQERCTAKSTMYTVNLIAGLLGKTVKDLVTGNQPITTLDWSVDKNSAVWFNGETKGTM